MGEPARVHQLEQITRRARSGEVDFPNLYRAEWKFLTPLDALGAGTTSEKRVMEATFADSLEQAIGSAARA